MLAYLDNINLVPNVLPSYILPIKRAVLVFPVVALLLFVPLCLLHFRRYGRLYVPRALVFYAFVFYSISVFFLTVLPLPELTPTFCDEWGGTKTPRLVPFASLVDIRAFALKADLGFSPRDLLRNSAFLQVFFNFLLLLPLGVFLRVLFKRTFLQALALAFTTTLFFEVTQLTGIYGLYPCPYRLFELMTCGSTRQGHLSALGLPPPLRKGFQDSVNPCAS